MKDKKKDEKKPHAHRWGPIERARFTGNPHRKCTVPGCREITLDLGRE